MKKKLGYAIYHPKKQKFLGFSGNLGLRFTWRSLPPEFYNRKRAITLLPGCPEGCIVKEVFYFWEE